MSQAVVVHSLPGAVEVREKFQEVLAFQRLVHQHLVPDHDFGIIPGTQKPTLLKPGAEKLVKLLELADCYVIESSIEDWDRPLFTYTIKCQLKRTDGLIAAEGLGQCSTMEDRYRWRWVFESDIPVDLDKASLKKRTGTGKNGRPYTQYRTPNDDIYTQINTVLKMAKKRALVDAALSVGRLSDLFTQDMEDIRPSTVEGDFREMPEQAPASATPSQSEAVKQTAERIQEGAPDPIPFPDEPSNDDMICKCGKPRVRRGGIKNGKAWAAMFCVVNGADGKSVCQPEWLEV